MIEEFFNIESSARIDAFLREKLPAIMEDKNISGKEISNSKIRRLFFLKAIFVNSRECRNPSLRLKRGDKLDIRFDESAFFYEKENNDIDFTLTKDDVLYEDEVIIVVNKPAFIPSEPTVVKDRKNMHGKVVEYLWAQNPSLRNPPYAGIMHRLDRETSGALLFTKSRTVNREISAMFSDHSLRKTYIALCSPKTKTNMKKGDTFYVDNYIGRITGKSSQCKIGVLQQAKGGQRAVTDFRVMDVIEKNGKKLYVMECRLHTGRTHQIRVHLSLSGLPIVGDELYGSTFSLAEHNNRIMLHAKSLEFVHPLTKENMLVEAPTPF